MSGLKSQPFAKSGEIIPAAYKKQHLLNNLNLKLSNTITINHQKKNTWNFKAIKNLLSSAFIFKSSSYSLHQFIFINQKTIFNIQNLTFTNLFIVHLNYNHAPYHKIYLHLYPRRFL